MNSDDSPYSRILDYTQKCVYCGYCSICPTYRELGWETNHPRGILEQIRSYIEDDLSREAEKTLFNAVFDCTLCGACENICIVDIPLIDIWLEIRKEAYNKGLWSQDLIQLTEEVKSKHNIFGAKNEDRLKWAEEKGLDIKDKVGKKSPNLYFVGCQVSYSPDKQKIAENIIKIFEGANVDYTLLGEKEWCCGSPIFMGGGKELGKSIAQHNFEEMKKLGIKNIIVSCAAGYKTFKNIYPSIIGDEWDINVLHISELIEQLINENKIVIDKGIKEKLTYKDPCELARITGLITPPRKIITLIPDVRYEELRSNKSNSLCCGGGGLLNINNKELTEKVNDKLIDEIEYSEADIVVTTCPTGMEIIKEGIERRKLNVEVIDLTELVVRVMKEKGQKAHIEKKKKRGKKNEN